jgi:hypothetical protein
MGTVKYIDGRLVSQECFFTLLSTLVVDAIVGKEVELKVNMLKSLKMPLWEPGCH